MKVLFEPLTLIVEVPQVKRAGLQLLVQTVQLTVPEPRSSVLLALSDQMKALEPPELQLNV